MMRKMMVVAAFALILSACRMDIAVEMQLNEDGSGTGALVFSVDDQMRDLIDQGGQAVSPEDFFELLGINTSTVTITEERDGDFTRTTAAGTYAEFDDLKNMFAVGSDLSAIKEASFVRVDDEVTLTGTLVFDLAANVPDNAPVGLETISQFITITAAVDMPGEVIEHNADRVTEDGVLIWDFTLLDPPRTIMAVADVSERAAATESSDYVPAAAAAAGGVILAVLVWRRRRAKPAAPNG